MWISQKLRLTSMNGLDLDICGYHIGWCGKSYHSKNESSRKNIHYHIHTTSQTTTVEWIWMWRRRTNLELIFHVMIDFYRFTSHSAHTTHSFSSLRHCNCVFHKFNVFMAFCTLSPVEIARTEFAEGVRKTSKGLLSFNWCKPDKRFVVIPRSSTGSNVRK